MISFLQILSGCITHANGTIAPDPLHTLAELFAPTLDPV